MTKAVSIRDICFITIVLLLCEHGHFSVNFVTHGSSCPPPTTILFGLIRHILPLFPDKISSRDSRLPDRFDTQAYLHIFLLTLEKQEKKTF